ncbi:MAG: acyl carrier protein [Candidatus Omnitrophica bacterium]|nr:acyl carrier protein [Candidatus Omnitrophota bacterium]MDD5592671.1 acyl carrier protein [Candidatus Omnitrophota bacterium]
MDTTIETKVKEALASALGAGGEPGDIELTDSLNDDLAMDDLDRIEAIMALEEAFGIEIPDEDAAKFLTVQDIITYVTDKKKA